MLVFNNWPRVWPILVDVTAWLSFLAAGLLCWPAPYGTPAGHRTSHHHHRRRISTPTGLLLLTCFASIEYTIHTSALFFLLFALFCLLLYSRSCSVRSEDQTALFNVEKSERCATSTAQSARPRDTGFCLSRSPNRPPFEKHIVTHIWGATE